MDYVWNIEELAIGSFGTIISRGILYWSDKEKNWYRSGEWDVCLKILNGKWIFARSKKYCLI